MTITIGGIGTDGYALTEPRSVVENAGKLTLSGLVTGATLAAAGLIQNQFAGLSDKTDPFISITSTEYPRLNGFYVITGVDMTELQNISSGWSFVWTVALDRTQLSEFGGVEVLWSRIPVANSLGVGTWLYNLVTPYGSTQLSGIDLSGQYDSYGYEGPMSRCILNSSVAAESVVGYQIDPTLYRRGAARIEYGSENRIVVGRKMSPVPTLRLSNGFMRCSVVTGGGTTLYLSWWNGTAWSTPKLLAITGLAGAAWTSAFVQTNSVDAVCVRLLAGAGGGPYIVDLLLRRADRFVEVVVQTPSPNLPGIGISGTGELSSAITGGLKASTFDSDGIGYVLSCDIPFYGALSYVTASNYSPAYRFMAGATINGLSSLLYQDVQSLVYGFFGRSFHQSRLVSRLN